MTPAARVQAAIEVVDAWNDGAEGLDRVLAGWGRRHRFAGSGDRQAIADLVYDAVRRLRSAAWVAGRADNRAGRTVLAGSLLLDGTDPHSLFTGGRFAPGPLRPEEFCQGPALADAPRPVRLDLPDWLSAELARLPDAVLDAMRVRAPLDLRVNLLRATPGAAVAALARDDVSAEPVALSATALRVTAGQRRVQHSRAYEDGLVEIQDSASQAATDLAGVLPGETVLDLCAGGGGKTLALAAAMGNRGRLLAHDVAPARIAALPARARRAGARIEIVASTDLPNLRGVPDLVLVDAPCSGSGAWRRYPDACWRLTPKRLDELCAIQRRVLAQAADLVRPGGRVLYVTCSLLDRENAAIADAFLHAAPDWMRSAERCWTPLDGGDGFYAVLLHAPEIHAKIDHSFGNVV